MSSTHSNPIKVMFPSSFCQISIVTIAFLVRDKFRALVWGKILCLSVGARNITWPGFKAIGVSTALWKSYSTPSETTIVFLAKNDNSDDYEQVELHGNFIPAKEKCAR